MYERLNNGSIECIGKVGKVIPPTIVSPLTVERSKPRLCINLMYLNNWIQDITFSLDTLKDIPRLVHPNAFFTSIDDKSAFDNVKLNPVSYDLVAFQWGGYFFRFKTIPFGFKLSSYFYHILNLQPTIYIRKHFSIPIFLYIDDRLIEEIRQRRLQTGYECAITACYIVCQILLRLGYSIGLDKSVLLPTQTPVHLGFIVDSVNNCFRITNSKLQKFKAFREYCLSKKFITALDLQKLAGRCVSFMLAVPATKLYTREMNASISFCLKSGKPVLMSGSLLAEINTWRFLDTWTGTLEWKQEKHLSVQMYTDSSMFKWGGVINFSEKTVEISDYWPEQMRSDHIMVLEAKALLNVLTSVKGRIKHHRVDALVDSQPLLNSWNNQGSKCTLLNSVLKDIFKFTLDADIILNLSYVGTKSNLADAGSRRLDKSDACLHESIWEVVQKELGGQSGHTLDLMALDSNCMKTKEGLPLKHYTPYDTPGSSGTNMFAQSIRKTENCYVFPPISLIIPVIRFILESGVSCTVVVPSVANISMWLPSFQECIADAFIIGFEGQKNVLKYPSKNGFVNDKFGLPWNLWCLRIVNTSVQFWTYGQLLFRFNSDSSKNCNFVCIGDSMIKFLFNRRQFSNSMTHIFAEGGAMVIQIHSHVMHMVSKYPPKLLLIHGGINNLSKTYLFKDEFEQMSVTKLQIIDLEASLQKLSLFHHGMRIIISAIVHTKDGFLNARLDVINHELYQMCDRNGWYYMDNNNIRYEHLKDTVHLNVIGEDVFLRNIHSATENCLGL